LTDLLSFPTRRSSDLFLALVINNIGEPDLIIDDGSHINEHVIESFNFLFPRLKSGGIYVIEDVQTSYWVDYGGDNIEMNNNTTRSEEHTSELQSRENL